MPGIRRATRERALDEASFLKTIPALMASPLGRDDDRGQGAGGAGHGQSQIPIEPAAIQTRCQRRLPRESSALTDEELMGLAMKSV